MLKRFCKLIFHWMGWKTEGKINPNLKKLVFIAAPHTSNWDFAVGMLARKILGLEYVKFIAKDQLFRFPLGYIFRWLGGYPVDRSKHNNLVDAVVELYDSKERFAIAIAPEGTRSRATRLKTGFYHIARLAKVPIVMVGINFKTKVITFCEPFHPSGDQQADFERILAFFRTQVGKYPELGIDESHSFNLPETSA